MNFSRFRCLLLVLCVPWLAHGQTVNRGSDGYGRLRFGRSGC